MDLQVWSQWAQRHRTEAALCVLMVLRFMTVCFVAELRLCSSQDFFGFVLFQKWKFLIYLSVSFSTETCTSVLAFRDYKLKNSLLVPVYLVQHMYCALSLLNKQTNKNINKSVLAEDCKYKRIFIFWLRRLIWGGWCKWEATEQKHKHRWGWWSRDVNAEGMKQHLRLLQSMKDAFWKLFSVPQCWD